MARKTTALNVILDASGAKKGADDFDAATRRVEKGGKRATGATERSAASMDRLAASAKRFIGISAGIFAATQFVKTADQLTLLENRLRLTVRTEQDLVDVQRELVDLSIETRSSFQGNADLFARLAVASKDLGTSQDELLTVTKALNQAVALSGATATEAEGAIIQLSQGIASGTLRGDELRAVLEGLPKVADVIAESLGVTRGQLRQMGNEGRISAEIVLRAFKEAAESLDKDFGTTAKTTGQSLVQLRVATEDLVRQLNEAEGITPGLADGVDLLRSGVDLLADNASTLSAVIKGIAFGAIAKQIVAMGAAFRAAAVGAGTASAATGALSISVRGLRVATRRLLGPVGLVVTGLTILTEMMASAAEEAAFAEEELGSTEDRMESMTDTLDRLNEQLDKFGGTSVQIKLFQTRLRALQEQFSQVTDSAEGTQFKISEVRDALFSEEAKSFLERAAEGLESISREGFLNILAEAISINRELIKEQRNLAASDPFKLIVQNAETLDDQLRNSLQGALEGASSRADEARERIEGLEEKIRLINELPFDATGALRRGRSQDDAIQLLESQIEDARVQLQLGLEDVERFSESTGGFAKNLADLEEALGAIEPNQSLVENLGILESISDRITELKVEGAGEVLTDNDFGRLLEFERLLDSAIGLAKEELGEAGDDAAESFNTAFFGNIFASRALFEAMDRLKQDVDPDFFGNLFASRDTFSLFDRFGGGIKQADDFLNSIRSEIELVGASNEQRKRAAALSQAQAVAQQLHVDVRDRFIEQARELIDLQLETEASAASDEFIEQMRREASVRGLLVQGKTIEAEVQQILNQANDQGISLNNEQINTITELVRLEEKRNEALRERQEAEREAEQVRRAAAQAAGQALESFVFQNATAKEAVEGLIKSLIKLAFRFLVVKQLEAALSSISFGGGAPGVGEPGTSVVGPPAPSAKGNAIGDGIVPMARGGLITDTAIMPMRNGGLVMAGEDGTEAALPLTRTQSGELAVNAAGQQRGGGTTVINLSLPNVRSIDKGFGETKRQAQRQLQRISTPSSPGG